MIGIQDSKPRIHVGINTVDEKWKEDLKNNEYLYSRLACPQADKMSYPQAGILAN